MQMSQLSIQYLIATQKVLTEKKTIMETAIKTFDAEEATLDIQLAKLR
jgi:hypothetical protein